MSFSVAWNIPAAHKTSTKNRKIQHPIFQKVPLNKAEVDCQLLLYYANQKFKNNEYCPMYTGFGKAISKRVCLKIIECKQECLNIIFIYLI